MQIGMRHFVYFSRNARTSGNFDTSDLMKAGRMDIAINVLIAAFFLSHDAREDVVLHLVFYGMPDPPKHLEIQIKEDLQISKKDVAGLIKRMLYKYKPGEKREVSNGCYIEKKSLLKIVEELEKAGTQVFILDKKGENLRELEIDKDKDVAFVLGDHEGMPAKELKRLKQVAEPVSLGKKMYFASQSVVIVNHELDMRGI